MRIHSFLASALLCTAAAISSLQAADPLPVEQVILAPVKALRHNDILAMFRSMPAAEQAEAKKGWDEQRAKPADPAEDAQMDQVLTMLLSPQAVDTLMVQLEPALKRIKPQDAANQLMLLGGFVTMGLGQDPENAQLAAASQGLLTDLAAWLPKSGIEDPAKARLAMASVVAATKALGVASAAEMRALSLDDLLDRLGASLKELKQVFAVYDLHMDKLLDSVAVAESQGTDDKRTLTMQFSAFGRVHTVPVKMVLKDGQWIPESKALTDSLAPMLQDQQEAPAPAQPAF